MHLRIDKGGISWSIERESTRVSDIKKRAFTARARPMVRRLIGADVLYDKLASQEITLIVRLRKKEISQSMNTEKP